MDEEDLLDDEKVEKRLSPHPFSFMKLQSLCIFLIVWGVVFGWLIHFSDFKGQLIILEVMLFVWAIIIIVVGVFASLITIRWSIFFLYLGAILVGVAVVYWQGFDVGTTGVFIPSYTIAVSIIGFLIVELYRRSHKYIISNLRITFKGGILTKRERTLRYDKITDIDAKQGIVGQIFGFGTITPISQSGFGLGSDKSFAAGGVGVGGKKVKVLGIFGGGEEVQTPRARSYYELHGVHPYKEVKNLVEKMVQGNVITPYQQEQVAFQKQQVGLQKQMKDLLKKQTGPEDEQEQESEEENS